MSHFADRHRRPTDPAIRIIEITPDDAADLPETVTALNVATPGAVRVTTLDGSTATLSIHPGQAFPVSVRRVWLTGTTATGIRGLVCGNDAIPSQPGRNWPGLSRSAGQGPSASCRTSRQVSCPSARCPSEITC